MKSINLRSLFSLLVFLSISLCYSQAQDKSANDIDMEKLASQQQKLEGTFQIEMINTRSKPTFHISLYDKIEELRDETEVVYFDVSDIMRLKILPLSVIEDESFTPVERVTYIPSK